MPHLYVPPLILASASLRRQQLLQQLGLQFSIATQNIDENRFDHESALVYVSRMSIEKAGSALRAVTDSDTVIIAADTIVVVDEKIMGKPQDKDDAMRMLTTLSNRQHQVLSAVTVCNRQRSQSALSTSSVWFRAISETEALRYWQTGEPRGKAGAYAIQGMAAVFVKQLAGSYSGVMGLPLFETAQLLEAFSIPCLPVEPE